MLCHGGCSQRVKDWEARGTIICGFHKIQGTFLGVPVTSVFVFWGLYWGPLIVGNYGLNLGWGGPIGDT